MPIEAISPPTKLTIPSRYRDTIKLLFIAKHALGDGSRDKVDGDHAVYHREVRDVLEGMGLNVTAANSPEILFTKPDVDFVFSLLNRGGYFNSELMMPVLCTRLGIPYLGATPIVRGLVRRQASDEDGGSCARRADCGFGNIPSLRAD